MLSNKGDGQGKIILTDGKYSATTVASSSTSGLPSLKAEVEGGLVSTSCVIENVDDAKFSPIDGGRKAWSFMIGAFMVEGLMWGFPLTFGVFQRYYESNNIFSNSRHLPLVGTLATGISYLGTPLVTPFTIKYPKYQKHMICCGWAVCILALIASSYATQVWHLIVTQGFLYGVGFLVVYYPVLSMLNEWFVEQRGLAYGILFGSAGIYGLGLPFAIEKILRTYGHATTLRAYAVAIFVTVGPTLPLLRSRLPSRTTSAIQDNFNVSVLKKKAFFMVTFSNFFQGLAFFLPGIYLPSYASAIGLSASKAASVLSALNIAQIIGQISTGYLSDRFNPIFLMMGSTLSSGVAVLCIWGLSKNFDSLLIFGLLYGLFAGGYSVLYCRFATALSGRRATVLWLYSILEFQRGAGNIIGGSVSSLLAKEPLALTGYGVIKYEGVILFVGVGLLVSSLGGAGVFFRGHAKTSLSQIPE